MISVTQVFGFEQSVRRRGTPCGLGVSQRHPLVAVALKNDDHFMNDAACVFQLFISCSYSSTYTVS